MGGPENKFTAHAFESALFSHIVQYHDSTKNIAVSVVDGGQAVGENTGFTIDFHMQVIHCVAEAFPCQDLLQLFIELRPLQDVTGTLANVMLLPAQLTFCNRVVMFQ